MIGSVPVRAARRGPEAVPGPIDRVRPGSKHHILTDTQGVTLGVSLTCGNRDDVTPLLPLLDKVPAVAGAAGRPRRPSDTLFAEHRYHHGKYRRRLWQRGIRPVIAGRDQLAERRLPHERTRESPRFGAAGREPPSLRDRGRSGRGGRRGGARGASETCGPTP
ncbi:transposase [Streptomyces sp. NPDC047017]|uniref:transposase n=1 Tax=Streptomyces sp. NPDC047017 TaxID=3155024 RepID=UPI0033C5FEC8